MIKHIMYLLCSWILIQGCATNSPQLTQITLSYDDPTIEIKFSEISDTIEIIRIETNDSMLIPDFFVPRIGKKYIVAEYSGATHLFSRDGKHIRKMLTRGRGPEQYLSPLSEYIDNEKEKYFMTDYEGHLFSYDLREKKLLKRSKLPFPIQILQVSNDTLLGFPDFTLQRMTCPFQFCSFTSQGKIINTIADTIFNGSGFELSFCSSVNGQILLKTSKSDTVFTISHFNKIPAFTIQNIYNDHRFPLTTTIYAETFDHYYLITRNITITYDKEGKIIEIGMIGPSKTHQVNKKDYSSKIVEKVYIDTLGISVPFNSFNSVNSVHLAPKAPYFTISAFQFREALREKAEQNKLSPAMKKLYEEVKEDDNPLIFIGQYKK